MGKANLVPWFSWSPLALSFATLSFFVVVVVIVVVVVVVIIIVIVVVVVVVVDVVVVGIRISYRTWCRSNTWGTTNSCVPARVVSHEFGRLYGGVELCRLEPVGFPLPDEGVLPLQG